MAFVTVLTFTEKYEQFGFGLGGQQPAGFAAGCDQGMREMLTGWTTDWSSGPPLGEVR